MQAALGPSMASLLAIVAAARAVSFEAGGISVQLTADRQTIGSLQLNRFELAPNRSSHVSHRLGDVTLRARRVGAGPYSTLSSATAQSVVPADPPARGEFASASLCFQEAGLSLTLERHFAAAEGGEGIRMWFVLGNNGSGPVELGGFGASMVFADMSVHEGAANTLDGLAGSCSFVDASIGSHHGFVSVTRVTGLGPVLLVVPEAGTEFQAWRPLTEAAGGSFYEISSLTKAYSENEWANATGSQWVEPSSAVLAPGKQMVFSYRLLASSSVRAKEDTLISAGFAVMRAVPSYAIATDMQAFLHLLPPRGQHIQNTSVFPSGNLILGSPVPAGQRGFYAVAVRGAIHGRARVTVGYSDGSQHVASYFVLPPLNVHVQKYAQFLAEFFKLGPCLGLAIAQLKEQLFFMKSNYLLQLECY